MVTIQERIKEIEEELRNTEYNKATQKHIGLLKAKLSRLEIEERPTVNGHLSTLADFGTAYFGQDFTGITGTGYATINGTTGPIASFSYESITMVTYSSILAQPSALISNGSSFTVTYVASSHGSKKVK